VNLHSSDQDGAVDLWWVRLEPSGGGPNDGMLSASEKKRAASTVSAAARRRFILGRIKLREILSGYCRVDPSDVPLLESDAGKPCLASDTLGTTFNFSHAGDLGVVAVTTNARIGVDIESRQARTLSAFYWLHREERREIRSLSPDVQHEARLGVWCRKEATLKAVGCGLRFPLHGFRVSVPPDSAKLLAWPDENSTLHLQDIDAGPHYLGALAMDRPPSRIRLRGWA
jgi:4'-phosphopantetheinyl transferase